VTSRASAALSIDDVAKSYGSTVALGGVSFDVAKGTVHALLGGNGSGKSTLVKVLAGVVQADQGVLRIGGEKHDARLVTPAAARDAGFRFVHQQSSTFPDLTVAENLALGHGFERGVARAVNWRAQRRRAAAVLERFGIDADPRQPLSSLTAARQTMVAIARGLQDQEDDDRGLIVLDEPTASLPAREVDVLLEALRRYAGQGQTIIYVSHRIEEVLAVADAATVLRDGRVLATKPRHELSHGSVVELIAGRAVEDARTTRRPGTASGAVVLESRGLRGGAVRDATFTLREGEILGVAGLLGSGRTTLLRLLFGVLQPEDGELRMAGEPVRLASSAAAMREGLALVPEDRQREAGFADMSVAENLSMATVRSYWRGGRLRLGAERTDARELLKAYLIRAQSEQAPLSSLSGGNQQKVIVARWLRRNPRVLLLDEPTQGVDVGARAEIYSLIRNATAGGTAVVVVSSDLQELAGLSDRCLLLDRGRTAGSVSGPDLTHTHLNRMLLHREEISA
jgi:ribose transport system ATP-binding protein